MKTLASLLILAAAPGFAVAQATKEDLKKLAKAGVSDDVILAYIKANGFEGKPSSDDLIDMKSAGLTDKVLAGILTPVQASATPSATYVERPSNGYATGYLSVNPSYTYSSSYYTPTYVRYYTGSFYRPHYSSYSRPYYGSYYRSSYCAPRHSFSYSSSRHCRSGFSARVRW